MNHAQDRQRKLPRVGPPAIRASVTMEPVGPAAGAEGGAFQTEPVRAEVGAPLSGGEDGGRLLVTLRGLVGKLSECEELLGRPGLRVHGERSGVAGGRAVVSVGPSDPVGAVETCKRVADALFALVRTIPGATVRVVSVDHPDRPIYEPAA
ncbi:hypothetical protein [Gemmata sp.]|uniref:hypothetical protein n=1 Tax=Gemmata sp. TaxID=1914242 RepID=UPI003F722C6B